MLIIINYNYNFGHFCPLFTLLLLGNQTHKKRLVIFSPFCFESLEKVSQKSKFYCFLAQTQWLIKTKEGYNRQPGLHHLIAVSFKLR